MHRSRRWSKLLPAVALAALAGSGPAIAIPPKLTVVNSVFLRFGSFAVPTSGYREISPTGGVTGAGIFALNSAGTGPAQFTVQYDRGNNSKQALNLTIDMVFSAPPNFSQAGLTARLTRLQSDLPGYATIAPGQVVRLQVVNCVQRVCSRSFNLGGRLDVDRGFGGGVVEIPIPVDAVVIAER